MVNARAFSVHSFFGKLAALAKGFDFHRAAKQGELPQAVSTVEKFLHFRNLDVLYPSAAYAEDVMMRLDVAVIAGNVVQEGYLAGLSHRTKLLENPMDGSQ